MLRCWGVCYGGCAMRATWNEEKQQWEVVIPKQQAYTVPQAAQIVGVNRRWIHSKVQSGDFEGEGITPEAPIAHEPFLDYVLHQSFRERRTAAREALKKWVQLSLES